MYTQFAAASAWGSVLLRMTAQSGVRLRYPKASLPHPREAGARPSIGLPVGQTADYRFPPDHECRGLHVQEFSDHWLVHLDRVHPACDLMEHLRQDAPIAWTSTGAFLGGLVGLLIGRTKDAFLAGAGVGALVAANALEKARAQGTGASEPRALANWLDQ